MNLDIIIVGTDRSTVRDDALGMYVSENSVALPTEMLPLCSVLAERASTLTVISSRSESGTPKAFWH